MNDFVRRKRHVGATAFAALVAACASAPSVVIREGDEELGVTAQTWIGKPDLFVPPGPLRTPDPLPGVRCTLSNDKGTWIVVTPASVRVPRSSSPLIVDCVLEGYKPVHGESRCLSESERRHEQDKFEGPLAAAMIPLTVLAAPVAPQVAADAAVRAGMYGASAVASQARTAGKPEYCTYGRVAPNMWPR